MRVRVRDGARVRVRARARARGRPAYELPLEMKGDIGRYRKIWGDMGR